MKGKVLVGVVLVVLGAVGMAVRDIPYKTEQEAFDIGIVRAKTVTEKNSPIPLIAGAALVVAGLALIVTGSRKA
jgi:hypothetical protein